MVTTIFDVYGGEGGEDDILGWLKLRINEMFTEHPDPIIKLFPYDPAKKYKVKIIVEEQSL